MMKVINHLGDDAGHTRLGIEPSTFHFISCIVHTHDRSKLENNTNNKDKT